MAPLLLPRAVLADVQAGHLPSLAYLYHNSPLDEHPPADVTKGTNTTWQAVDAVVEAGAWPDTVFMLTYDDWGGFDDHVATPAVEYTKDNVQLAFGPRVPLVMFGGRVRPGIDSRWCSHVSVAKTAIQLLGLPDLGVRRLDGDAGLADLVDATVGGVWLRRPSNGVRLVWLRRNRQRSLTPRRNLVRERHRPITTPTTVAIAPTVVR